MYVNANTLCARNIQFMVCSQVRELTVKNVQLKKNRHIWHPDIENRDIHQVYLRHNGAYTRLPSVKFANGVSFVACCSVLVAKPVHKFMIKEKRIAVYNLVRPPSEPKIRTSQKILEQPEL